MRLQKYLARCGLGSRRKMEEEIAEGKVTVNGETITAMGWQVDPQKDQVKYLGRLVQPEEELVYVLLYKPLETVTTVHDEKNRRTVVDLIAIPQRIYPVGRLDYWTSGLLILTNDGDFAYALTHPKHEIPKTYHAIVEGNVRDSQLEPIRNGMIVDEIQYAPAKAKVVRRHGENTLLEIVLVEGRNRQVRKMCEGIGHRVLELERVSMGPLTLGDLKPGKWRRLNVQEVNMLKEMAK